MVDRTKTREGKAMTMAEAVKRFLEDVKKAEAEQVKVMEALAKIRKWKGGR